MSTLNAKQRNKLPKSDFALPGQRKYPLPDRSHAQNALARASQSGNPNTMAKVKAAVNNKYPGLAQHVSKVTEK